MPMPAVRLRVDFAALCCVGPGKIALLEQIGRDGSLSQAARGLGMSYRRAWQLLDSINHSFREPVALTAKGGRRGGGATLTAFGRRLIRAYRSFDAEVQARAARHFRAIIPRAQHTPARRRATVMRLPDR
jgi:molybdate transport system regulatory protein